MTRIFCLFFALLATACGGAAFSFEPADLADGAGGSSSGGSSSGNDAGTPNGGDAKPDAETVPDAADASCACVTDLSNVGLSDFWIAFDITTTETSPKQMAVMSQRPSCDNVTAWWEVFLAGNSSYGIDTGAVFFQATTGNGVVDTPSTQRAVNDGQPHRVAISRTGGSTLTLTVDGYGAPQTGHAMSFGSLPPLQYSDICPYVSFDGHLSNLCISVGCALH